MSLELYTSEDYAADEYAALEARARRAAKRVGLRATKSRWRRRSINHQAGFMLVDPLMNACRAGERFELSPAAVIALCEELAAV
jgi:hypothetical protein